MHEIQRQIPCILRVLDAVPKKSKVEYLGFWGAEPTLSEDVILKCVDKSYNIFPNLRQISFSTNGINYKAIINIANAVLSKGINLEVQFSLDGPEYINGVNREPHILNEVIEHIRKLISAMNKKQFKGKLTISIKPTLTIENMKMLLEKQLVSDTVHFFDMLTQDISRVIQNDHIEFKPSAHYTLAVPGRYTKEDGIIFGKFLRELHKYSCTSYTFRFLRLIDFATALPSKPCMFTCSGGDTNMGLDHKGAMHICHRTFMLNENTYIEEILSMPEYKNWDVSLLRKNAIYLINRYFIVPINDRERVLRMSYATRCYHDFWRIRLASSVALIKELAIAGQIQSKYKNDDIATIFALFLNTALSCPMENILNTSCIEVMPVSLIRLWGNGAFGELMRNVLQRAERVA